MLVIAIYICFRSMFKDDTHKLCVTEVKYKPSYLGVAYSKP